MKVSFSVMLASGMIVSLFAGCGLGDVGNLDSSNSTSDMWADDGGYPWQPPYLHFNDAKNILILSMFYLKDGEEYKLGTASGQYRDYFLCMANQLKRFFEQEYPIPADMLDDDGQLKPGSYSEYYDPSCGSVLIKDPKEGAPKVTIWTINHPDDLIARLDEYADSGQPLFDRIVYMGHGSSKGTSFFGKPLARFVNGEDLCPGWSESYCYAPATVGHNYPYPDPARDEKGKLVPNVYFSNDKLQYLENYGEKLRGVLSSSGRIHMGSCHSARNVKYSVEPSFEGFNTFIEMMACITGVPVSGQADYTSGHNSNHRVIWLENEEVALPDVTSETLVAYPNSVSDAYHAYLEEHPDQDRNFTFSCHSKRRPTWWMPY